MGQCGINRWNQDIIKRLLLSCSGQDLTNLKNMLDNTGNYHSLFKLIYYDIRNSTVRNEILQHLEAEADDLRAYHGHRVGIKLVSDIDDTVRCSGGSFPAGCDARLPKKTIYPGCFQLFRELDKKPASNLVFLSARPHIYKDLSENASFKMFTEFSHQGLHTRPSLVSGYLNQGLLSALKSVLGIAHAWEAVGRQKAQFFDQYAQLFREYDFFFFGDNGQGDLLTGQTILASSANSAAASSSSEDSDSEFCPPSFKVLAVLIHEVLPLEKCLALTEKGPNWREQLKAEGLHFFKTHVGAASAIHEMVPDVLSAAELAAIARAAREEFDEVRRRESTWQADWRPFECDLQRDLTRIAVQVGDDSLSFLKDTQDVLDEAKDPHALFSHIFRPGRTETSYLTTAFSCRLSGDFGEEDD